MSLPFRWLLLLLVLMMVPGCTSPAGSTDAGEDAATDADEGASGDDGSVSGDDGGVAGDDGVAGDPGSDPGTDGGADPGDGGFEPYAVLSLNLHCFKLDGTSFASNQERFAAIAQVAASEDVRVMLVQEACVNESGDAMELLSAALTTATGAQWAKAWAPAHTAWEGTPDEAEEGVGLLARGGLSDVRTLEYFSQGGLRRVATGARLDPALGNLWVWSTHLELTDPAVRLAQARHTASAIVTLASPSHDLLVGGDFNDTPSSATCGALKDYGLRDLIPGLGQTRIDQLFAHRGAAVAALEQKLLFDGVATPVVSDHPGVLARLGPAEAPPVVETRISAHVDVGFGNYLSVRGDTAPLSWTTGWPAVNLAADLWLLILTEIPEGATFEYKALRNDTDYQTGPNASGTGGESLDVSPVF